MDNREFKCVVCGINLFRGAVINWEKNVDGVTNSFVTCPGRCVRDYLNGRKREKREREPISVGELLDI